MAAAGMDLLQSTRDLLQQIGRGQVSSSAYATGWAARLVELDEAMAAGAADWLRANQLPDGSWGAREPRYVHDRLASTLAAVTGLVRFGEADPRAVRRARQALQQLTDPRGLRADPAGATVGFEMIVPPLIDEAHALGIADLRTSALRRRLGRQREAKLSIFPERVISRFVTAAFSAEAAGPEGLPLLDVENLQEPNGSVGTTPSATAYYALHVRRGDPAAMSYLREIAANDDGGFPDVIPIDVFEAAWPLWNLALVGPLDPELLALCQPHLDSLEQAWNPGEGVGHAAAYTPNEVDDTGLAYDVLTRFDRSSVADIGAVLRYENDDHFCLFALETSTSVSANVHALGALRRARFELRHPSVQKILRFLRRTQVRNSYWFDKLHTSPYYPTAHAIIACAGYCDDLVRDSVEWILEVQNADGSWGHYLPTAEETAYSLQALAVWKRQGGRVSTAALRRGSAWLAEHASPPYPPLWIGKCLYCPTLVVHSAVLSALIMIQQEAG